MSGRSVRIVVVAAAPDLRQSTRTLRRMVDALHRRADAHVEVWFLRSDGLVPWEGSKVVDHLRTRPYTWPLSAVGLDRYAGWIRGAILRRWFRAAAPDAVILDDGHGARLLSSAPKPPLVAVRQNPEPATYAFLEPEPIDRGDLLLAPDPPTDPALGAWVHTPELQYEPSEVQAIVRAAAAARRPLRERLGVPEGTPLVVGWGEDGWIDGSDMFVRCLWYLADRHGIEAHGLWLGTVDDEVEVRELRAEAARCGLGDRLHLVADAVEAERWAGDVTLLPYRLGAEIVDLRRAAAADQTVVTFEPAAIHGRWIAEVPFLDLEAAAAAVHQGLVARAATWDPEVSADGWAARFVEAVERERRR